MEIIEDDLSAVDIAQLLQQHLDHMHQISPPESVHALDIEALRKSHITFWCARQNNQLLGCGALQELNPRWGEIKSMRTAQNHRRKGVADNLLRHIIDEGVKRGYQRLSLETGTTEHFGAAQRLYEKYGFTPCGPFSDYTEHPHSLFMTREL